MSSGKYTMNREMFFLMLLFQQNGLFWLLPYFLVRENGTAGLCGILAGVIAAVVIIGAGQYWSAHMPNCGFVSALQEKNRLFGTIAGLLFCLFYICFAVMMLYSFTDVLQKQLLEDTPRIVLCIVTVFLAGWMGCGGLKAIMRMNMLCTAALILVLFGSIAGTLDVFNVEQALPLQINNLTQFQHAATYSVFCYSGFLVLFMLYPVSGYSPSLGRTLFGAAITGTVLLLLWIFYALCILGQHSLKTILWIPIHLARMVQVGSLMDQVESLFVVLWMPMVVVSGSLLLWCASEGLSQLFGVRKTAIWHWGVSAVVLLLMLALGSTVRFLQALYMMANSMWMLLPVLLALVLWLAPKRRSRNEIGDGVSHCVDDSVSANDRAVL